ncbi:hypothetical protein D0866_14076 [Hortaea werneckii]|uniref:Uncharacterized protein n=1 Tax=Hortaea werneckii TaxID=91943 RepID=A0A3M6ZDP9_HORWE|nr:hypothetical protein D0866_14076 [Hortaea werneckii]
MPPKASKKAKEVTPEPKSKPKAKINATPSKPTPSKATPKKVKEPPTYKQLTKDNTGDATPVEVSFEGDSIQAKVKKTGGFGHVLKLDSSASFTLLKNVMLTEGPHEGHQAIIIRPAKAFEFLKLTKEIQARVYEYYFAQKGVVGETIVLDGKRANKEIYAKTFAEGSKTRVGLLAVNKEVCTTHLPSPTHPTNQPNPSPCPLSTQKNKSLNQTKPPTNHPSIPRSTPTPSPSSAPTP